MDNPVFFTKNGRYHTCPDRSVAGFCSPFPTLALTHSPTPFLISWAT
jgi:hypothetical protein